MYSKSLISLTALASLASCVAANNCAGWKPITTDQTATVEYLAAHDRPFLEGVIGHQEFGRSQGCWK